MGMIIFGYCLRCSNKGYTFERGDYIPLTELTDAQWAENVVEGTHFYRAVKVPCHNLSDPKHKQPVSD